MAHMSGTELVKAIETELEKKLHAAISKAVRTQIPAARRLRRPSHPRTLYVVNARKKVLPESDRDRAVLAYLRRVKRATPAELRAKVAAGNRNIVAGAIWRLQQGGWVRRERLS